MESECCICLDAAPDVLIVPCNHKIVCETCYKLIDTCPICRCKIENSDKIYSTIVEDIYINERYNEMDDDIDEVRSKLCVLAMSGMCVLFAVVGFCVSWM